MDPLPHGLQKRYTSPQIAFIFPEQHPPTLLTMEPNTKTLLTHAGPVIRWLVATETPDLIPAADRRSLLSDLLACREVRRWLNLLGTGPVHHSKDSAAENALAKLGEYGLRAGIPELDDRALPYCAVDEGAPYHAEAIVLVPFLIRTGYASEPRVARWITTRIETLYEQAKKGDYYLYMDDSDKTSLPPSQRDKPFYRPHLGQHWTELRLPTCYDLYAMAYLPKTDPDTCEKIETIVAYLLDPRFQSAVDGYVWNRRLRRPYAAGRVFLACLPGEENPQRLVLFLEMLAAFAAGRQSDWFRAGIAHLETYRTERGTYRFPRSYLTEKSGHYLYTGAHMGLGESPRNEAALEIESTFRMLRLKRLISAV